MNTLLLHCRPGFEGEVYAEISEHAAILEVAGYAKARPDSASAEFICSESGGAERLMSIPGTVPQPHAMPPGCRFAPRCAHATPECNAAPVKADIPAAGRLTRCIRWKEVT